MNSQSNRSAQRKPLASPACNHSAHKATYNEIETQRTKGAKTIRYTPSTESRTTAPIEAVLFDYGMVLSAPPDPAAWARMRTITSLDEPALHAAYWAHRHDYDRGTLTGTAYWHGVGAHAGTTFNAEQIEALLHADTDLWTALNTPMVEWAARLQRAGLRTGILSNIGDSIAAGVCARLPWLAGFHHCTWSHALRMAKPEPSIYIETARALATPLPNILFLDDREDNIAAAAAVGMQTLRYTEHDLFEREMRRRGLAWLLEIDGSTPVHRPVQPPALEPTP